MLLSMPLLTWVYWWVPSTFWLLHTGFSIWGLQSWHTISSRRLSASRAVGQGRTYIPTERAVEKAGGKQESLGHIAMSCRKITGTLQNWYSMWWCAIYDEVLQCHCDTCVASWWNHTVAPISWQQEVEDRRNCQIVLFSFHGENKLLL